MMQRTSRLFVLAFVFLAPAAPAAHAGDADRMPRSADGVAGAVLAAEDEGSIAVLAELPSIDPFSVVEHAMIREADALVADGGSEAFWRAVARYAKAASEQPAGRGLPAVVSAWQSAEPAAHVAERALRVALGRTTDYIKGGGHANVVAIVDDALAVAPPAASLAAPQLRIRKAASVNTLRRGDARTLAQSVLEEARTRQWLSLEALALHVLTNAHHVAMDIPAARDTARQELAARESLGDGKRTGLARANLAMLTWRVGDRITALQIGAQAVEELEAAGHKRAVLRLLAQLAAYRRDVGDGARALEMLDSVLERSTTEPLFRLHADALLRKALVLVSLGRLAGARTLIDRLLADRRLAPRTWLRAQALKHRASIDFASGRMREAERGALEALEIHIERNERQYVLGARILLGHVYAAQHRHEEAIEVYRDQRDAAAKAGDPVTSRWLEIAISWCLNELGRHDEATTLAERLRTQARADKDLRQEALALRTIGSVHVAKGEHERARTALSHALTLLHDLGEGDSTTATGVRDQLALSHLRAARHADAAHLARESVEKLLRQRQGFGERELSRLLYSTSLGTYVGIEAEFARAQELQGAEREKVLRSALWFGEAQRSLVLADSILNAGAYRAAAAPEALLAEEDRARLEVQRLQQALVRAITADAVDLKEIVVLRNDLRTARQELDRHAAAVERAVQRDAALARTPLATVDEIRRWLPADAALLLYLRGKEHVYACVLTQGALALVDIGRDAAVFGPVRNYLDLVSTPAGAEARLAAKLYERLLRPVEQHLDPAKRLVICPTGPLNFVPFEALIRTDAGHTQRVIRRWAISYAPSATVLGLLRDVAAPGRGLVALGDPVYPAETPDESAVASRGLASLRRLVASGHEVREIAALFKEDGEPRTVLLRAEATPDRLTQALASAGPRLRAVHLACHGFVDTEHPRLSGLVLAGGAVLSVESLYRMRIDADLAVLSACDSGRGKTMRGEGVIGMTRGFFRAGVPRVVVSSWKVQDASTRELMTDFYRAHVRDGLSASAALRSAKLKMLDSAAHRHPFHWAAFQLWGRYD